MLPPILVELKANAGEFMTKMGEARHEVAKLGTESSAHMQKFAAVGKAALFGIGAAAVVVGGFGIEMADKFETSHAKLEAALKANGTSMDVWGGQISATDKRMERLGYTNAQTEDTLGRLTVALGDPAKAMAVMSTAADLARAKNIDLATAGVAVAKATEGNTRALKQMGIDLPINTKSAEGLKIAQESLRTATEAYSVQVTRLHEKHKVTAADLATLKVAHDHLRFAQEQVNQAQHAGTLILDALNKRLGGQSQAYTETFAGKVTVLKAQIEDLGVKIGLALIPILEKAATVTMGVVNWFERHRTTAMLLAGVIGGVLVVAITAYIAELVIAAAASAASLGAMIAKTIMWAATTTGAAGEAEVAWVAANMGMLAATVASATAMLVAWGPILLAVAAIGIAAYELYKHWGAVWGGIKTVFSAVWNFLRQHFGLILTVMFGPLGFALAELIHHWSAVWSAVSAVISAVYNNSIKPIGRLIGLELRIIGSVLSWLYNHAWSPLWNGIESVVSSVWGTIGPIFDAIKSAIGDITGGISKVISIASHLPGASAAKSLFSHFAGGTDYAPGGMALVGERGPELVNLPRGSQVFPHGTGPRGGGGTIVNFNGPVYGSDSDELARKVRDALLRMQGRGGKLGFAT